MSKKKEIEMEIIWKDPKEISQEEIDFRTSQALSILINEKDILNYLRKNKSSTNIKREGERGRFSK